MIHPTALIDPSAEVHATAVVGPYVVIDAGVVLGPECRLGPHVHLTGRAQIGARNHFFTGCVIGEAPQDLKYKGEPTLVRIADDNVFREHVTIHRGTAAQTETVIGSGNLFMASAHVGHNCTIGDQNIFVNGCMLGGHVQVADRVFISGNCMVHQFVRLGTLALMQGRAGVSKDVPPFTVAAGVNSLCGLNTVGLRRAGLDSRQRLQLRELYHRLFRGEAGPRITAAAVASEYPDAAAQTLLTFIQSSKRGVCGHRAAGGDEEEGED